jgi:hypothetical protein
MEEIEAPVVAQEEAPHQVAVRLALDAAREARKQAAAATDRLLTALPPNLEAAIRQRAAQAQPFVPHALCSLVGFLLGRWLGGRRRRRGAPARGAAQARRGSEPLEKQLLRSESSAEAAAVEVRALHAEMQRLEGALARSRAAPAGGGDDMRVRLEEAAAAYDTLSRVLEAERTSAALSLEHAELEKELLRQQLGECRSNVNTLLSALEEASTSEMAGMQSLMRTPITAAHRPAPPPPPAAPRPPAPTPAAGPEALGQQAAAHFTKLFSF